MPITISGSTGIAGVDGSASTPAVQGTDTNTGVAFPAADTVAVATGGTERMRVDSSGNVGIGTSSPSQKFEVNGQGLFKNDTNDLIRILSDSGAMEIVRASGDAYVDLKSTDAEDYDVRLQSAGTSGLFRVSVAGSIGLDIDSSANLKFNSGYGSIATAYGCRAWVNFNGTGTLSIRGSGNVSSVTDHGTGDFTVNFSNSLTDANYSVVASGDGPVNGQHCTAYVAYGGVRSTFLSSAVAVSWFNATNSASRADPAYALISVFR